jgi:uncharacterized protein
LPQPCSTDLPLRAAENGVRVAVRLSPRAHADRIEGIAGRAAGGVTLRVSVIAPAAEGRANEALLRLLAKEWRIARRELAIVAGGKGRDKIVHVAGAADALIDRLRAALAAAMQSGGG